MKLDRHTRKHSSKHDHCTCQKWNGKLHVINIATLPGTVAILAQGTHWAVAVMQAFLLCNFDFKNLDITLVSMHNKTLSWAQDVARAAYVIKFICNQICRHSFCTWAQDVARTAYIVKFICNQICCRQIHLQSNLPSLFIISGLKTSRKLRVLSNSFVIESVVAHCTLAQDAARAAHIIKFIYNQICRRSSHLGSERSESCVYCHIHLQFHMPFFIVHECILAQDIAEAASIVTLICN